MKSEIILKKSAFLLLFTDIIPKLVGKNEPIMIFPLQLYMHLVLSEKVVYILNNNYDRNCTYI